MKWTPPSLNWQTGGVHVKGSLGYFRASPIHKQGVRYLPVTRLARVVSLAF